MTDKDLDPKKLKKDFDNVVKTVNNLTTQIQELEKRKARLLRLKDELAEMIVALTGEMPRLPDKLLFDFGPNTTIGDAVEVILQEKGPLPTKEIFEILKNSKVRMSLKHPRIVLINAIKRDTQKRFSVRKDLRIELAKGR